MKTVISASRRTDLVASYPDELIRLLEQYPPETVHSIVLWTKNATNLCGNKALRKTLQNYDQLFVHFSITGMGGGPLEPNIPETEDSLALVPEIVKLTGSPQRVSIRFDPIVNLSIDCKQYTNLYEFPGIAESVAESGVERITTSWMTFYKKVARRFAPRNIELIEFDKEQQVSYMLQECNRLGLLLNACCVEGLPKSSCIDGQMLQSLHPVGERCSQAKASGQRPLCGCTASRDIGWYSQTCGGGCLYCYARPAP